MTAEVDTTSETEKPIKKNREIKRVIEVNVKGRVKWYDVAKHYGFISRDDEGGDVFVHRSVISQCMRRFPSLRSGEEVQFSVVETNQGIEADLVTGPEGKPVLGQISRYARRNGGRIRGNQYDGYVHSDNPSGGENGDHQHHRPLHKRGGHRGAQQGKENPPSGDVATASGDAHDQPSEGDSPNQSDVRPRRPRRRPLANRNRNPPQSGNGVVPENAVPHQSDAGDEQQLSRMRRRPRRRRPVNGQSTPKKAEVNDKEGQHGEAEGQVNGYHSQRRRGGAHRGYRRRNSNPKQANSEGVHSTQTDLAVEEIAAATEQCSLNDASPVLAHTVEEVVAK